MKSFKSLIGKITLFTALALCCACLLGACQSSVAAAPQDEFTIPEPTPHPEATPDMAAMTAAPVTEPVATLTAEPTATPDDGLPYYIYVEKGSFTLTIYEKDELGEYTVVNSAYRIAHGGNKTPAGKFELGSYESRDRWHDFPDGGTVQYATHYEGRLYIHSPLYATSDPTQMWPKYFDGEKGIGKESTGGCLRMVTEAAKFIYENCPPGTVLEIVNGSPKGTTSDDPPKRNGLRIDPTDVETLKANGYTE